MSNADYVPRTATAAKEAATAGKDLLNAWKDFHATLPDSMPTDQKDALADIFRRSYHLTLGMSKRST